MKKKNWNHIQSLISPLKEVLQIFNVWLSKRNCACVYWDTDCKIQCADKPWPFSWRNSDCEQAKMTRWGRNMNLGTGLASPHQNSVSLRLKQGVCSRRSLADFWDQALCLQSELAMVVSKPPSSWNSQHSPGIVCLSALGPCFQSGKNGCELAIFIWALGPRFQNPGSGLEIIAC